MEEDYYDFEDPVGLQVDEEPIPTPAQPFQVKDYGGRVDWNKVNQAVGTYLRVRDFQSRQQEAAKKAEREAIRFQGMTEYQQLIDGGATPQEALRRTGSKIWFENPTGFGSAVRQMNTPSIPKIVDVNGYKVFDFGDRYQVAPGQNPNKERDMDEFTKKHEYLSAQKAFEATKKGIKQPDGTFKADDAAVADSARRYRIAGEQLRAPMQNKEEEKVIVTKGGKKFRLPKSQLEAAKKEGYELVE